MERHLIKTLIAAILVVATTACNDEKKEDSSALTAEIRDIDSLIQKFPDSVSLLIEYGHFYLDKYQFDKVIPSASKAFRIDSNNVESRMLYALMLNNKPDRTLEEVVSAQRNFGVVLKKQPKNLRALVQKASTYSLMQNFDNSFKYINEALRIDPRYRDAYVLKGTNYLSLGKVDLAKSSYETAVQQDPEFWFAYLNLGNLYLAENNKVCIEYYTTAVDIKPDDMDLLYSLAYAHQTFGNVDQSLETYRHMLEVDSTFAMAKFQQGHIKQFLEKDRDSAMFFYNEAIIMEPTFVEAWHNLGMCHEAKGDRPKALSAYGKALKYKPDFELSRKAADRLR
jgi:tetratricopeptide (TPR) repeat protein